MSIPFPTHDRSSRLLRLSMVGLSALQEQTVAAAARSIAERDALTVEWTVDPAAASVIVVDGLSLTAHAIVETYFHDHGKMLLVIGGNWIDSYPRVAVVHPPLTKWTIADRLASCFRALGFAGRSRGSARGVPPARAR